MNLSANLEVIAPCSAETPKEVEPLPKGGNLKGFQPCVFWLKSSFLGGRVAKKFLLQMTSSRYHWLRP